MTQFKRDFGQEQGFTLVEVMVALSVLAIATVGLIRASEAHIDLIRAARARVLAQWVAENRLVELEISHRAVSGQQTVRMLDTEWLVDVRAKATDDPDLASVDVMVRRPKARGPLVTLTGFVDTGA